VAVNITPDPIPDPAVEHLLDHDASPDRVLALEPEDLDGYTVEIWSSTSPRRARSPWLL
jgi:hypothetical protein